MPRRDGETFFRGTAMALFSLNYFAGAGRHLDADEVGSRAYRGSGRVRLEGAFWTYAGVDRSPLDHAALVDPGEPAHRGFWRLRVAPARARQRGGEQRRLLRGEIARGLVEVAARRGRDAE